MAAGILLLFTVGAAIGQQGQSAPPTAPIVQPGAPGQPSKIVSAASLAKSPRGPAPADTSFMQGMIHHHAQAVEMTDLLRTRTRTKDLQALARRISISQTDEIKSMKQWLEERGKPAMDHSHMVDGKMPL